MATKHRPMGNTDRGLKDDALLELETAIQLVEFVLKKCRPMTEAEKDSKLKDVLIALLRAIKKLVLMGTES